MKKNEILLLFYLLVCFLFRGGWDAEILIPFLGLTGTISIIYWASIFVKREQIAISFANLIFFIFIIFLMVSTGISSDKSKSIYELLKYFIYYEVLAIFVNTSSNKFLFKIIKLLTGLGIIFSLYALYQQIYLFPYLDKFGIKTLTNIRSFANFVHPNSLALFLLFALTVNLYLFSKSSKIILSVSLYLILIIGFILTFSFVNFLLFIFILIYLLVSKNNFQKKFLCLLLFIFLAGGISTKYFKNNLNEALKLSSKKYSLNSRLSYWKSSAYLARKNLIWGSGLGTFSVFLPVISKDGYFSVYPHNSYLQILAEGGLINLFFWLWLVFFMVFAISFNLKKIPFKNYELPIKLLIFVYLLVFLFQIGVDLSLNVISIGILFFSVSGLMLPKINLKKYFRNFYIILNFVLGIVIFTYGMKMFLSNNYYILGRQYLSQGNLEKTKNYFERSLTLDNNNKEAIYLLSGVYIKQKEYLKAEKFLQLKIKLFPSDYKLYLFLAQDYLAFQNFNLAEKSIKKSRALNPWDIYGEFYLANFYILQNELNKAQKVIYKIKSNPYFKSGYVDNLKVSNYYYFISQILKEKYKMNNYLYLKLIVYTLEQAYSFSANEKIKQELLIWKKKTK